MKNIKITNNVPCLFRIDSDHNVIEYKKVYKYFLTVNNKGYSFIRKKDLKAFLYEKIEDKTYHNKNEIEEQKVSCIVTNRSIINDVIKVHIYDLFNISSFWDNY